MEICILNLYTYVKEYVLFQVTTMLLRSTDCSQIALLRLHRPEMREAQGQVITLDVDSPRSSSALTTGQELQSLSDEIRLALRSPTRPWKQQLPMLKLGNYRGAASSVGRYLTTSDDRVVEYSVTRVLHDCVSRMRQHVQIVETVDQGRMLLLDGFVNLAESDRVPYTHKIMGLPEVITGLEM